MKTKEELNALRNEVEALNTKLAELTGEELEQVTGGNAFTEWLSDAWDWFTGAGQNKKKEKIGNGTPI